MGHWEMLAHFKRRYGRLEDVPVRLGAFCRRVLGQANR